MYNVWLNIIETALERKPTNTHSEQIKRLILEYNADVPCHVFNIEKERYNHWIALTPQFYHNGAVYYKLKNFSADAHALSLIEKVPGEPTYDDIQRQVCEAQENNILEQLDKESELKNHY